MNNSNHCRLLFLVIFLGFLFSTGVIRGQAQATTNDLRLWFIHPASTWNEALPVGNGKLGAMIFGGVHAERLQLNESSVWTGKDVDFVNPAAKAALPEVRKLLFAGKYAAAQKMAKEKMMGDKKVSSNYQTLGDLLLDFEHSTGDVSNYRRELDIDSAIARVNYTIGNVTFTREIFSSAPDQAMVIRLSTNRKGSLTFNAKLSRPGNKAAFNVSNNEIVMTEHVGDGVGVKMAARLKVIAESGNIAMNAASIRVEKADVVTLVFTAATDYRGDDPLIQSANSLSNVVSKNVDMLKKEHIKDYQQYFKRVDFNPGLSDGSYFPTDARIVAMQNGYVDPQLIK
jgi:alpha-L-fucosidase 2